MKMLCVYKCGTKQLFEHIAETDDRLWVVGDELVIERTYHPSDGFNGPPLPLDLKYVVIDREEKDGTIFYQLEYKGIKNAN